MADTKTSTIKTLEKRLSNGSHESVESKHGTLWKYNFELEDGTQGVVNAKSSDKTPYNVGDVVEYTFFRKFDEETVYKLKKSNSGAYTPSKSSYNDPVNNMRMAMSICHTAAINSFLFFNKKPTNQTSLFDLATYYWNWVTNEGKEKDRDVLQKKWYALEHAIQTIQFGEGYPVSSSDAIIKSAQDFFDHVMEVK